MAWLLALAAEQNSQPKEEASVIFDGFLVFLARESGTGQFVIGAVQITWSAGQFRGYSVGFLDNGCISAGQGKPAEGHSPPKSRGKQPKN